MSFDLSTFRLNSPLGKRILAGIREGNYAHPGEEEAIVLTLSKFGTDSGQRWLDAGCGRGGTAAFVVNKGWAQVTAFDIDQVSIEEARLHYPQVAFHACAVAGAPASITGTFDLIYAFNAFYAFPDQPGALRALRALAHDRTRLVLFDYTDRDGFYTNPMTELAEARHWQPIEPSRFPAMLSQAGWALEYEDNITGDYERWYIHFLSRLDARREALLEFAPAEAIDHTRGFFSALLAAIRVGDLGGAIFTARAA
jgi:cyclopropane fatty-acyl-phospholipid synthase-like methyltransferase